MWKGCSSCDRTALHKRPRYATSRHGARAPHPQWAPLWIVQRRVGVVVVTVVTRNAADFAGTGVKVLNPFVASASRQ